MAYHVAAAAPGIKAVLESTDIEVLDTIVYGKDSTRTNVNRLLANESFAAADVAFAIGGGKDRLRANIAALGEGHGPDMCKACGKCMTLCPQKIRIPDRMKEIAALLEDK